MIPPLARRMGVLAASFFLLASGLPTGGPGPARAAGTVSLSALGSAHTQDFNTLASSGTANTAVPTGWEFSESGTNANTTYRAGTGSDNTGDTYSFGAASNAERAFGGLRSGSLVPLIGAQFTNNTGGTIASLAVAYTGEQWRLGQNTTGRAADRLDFQLSTNATSLTTGTWTDHDSLDFSSPVVAGTVGALNGNVVPNWSALSFTITGLSLSNGSNFWIRWADSDLIPGADDGLAVDDFSLTPNGVVADTTPSVSNTSPADGSTDVPLGANLSVTFGEAVNVSGDWFRLACPTSGTRDVADTAVSGGPTTFTIDPVLNLAIGETCTLTVYAAQVSDQDSDDPPDVMTTDHVMSFTTVGPDSAPVVASSVPADEATSVPLNQNVTVSFSEPVNVTDPWFSLTCATSGAHPATVSGGPTSFTLNPTADFVYGELCTLVIDATNVTDQDSDDPPDNMLANFTTDFTTEADPCTLPYTPIYQIQGSGATVALTGTQTTQGVVVGDYEGASPALRGFFIQDSTGDGNLVTSDGIFVFEGSNANTVSVGDVVRVTGTAAENQGQSQVSVGTITKCGTGTVTPTDVTFPVAAPDFLEQYEGMLVRLPQTMDVTEHFQLGRFGQVVLSSGGRLRQPTNVVLPGAPALALQAANDLNKIILDDASQAQNPDPILFARGGHPLSASNTLRGGDTATGIVGVLNYTWAGNAASGNAYRVRPINALNGYVNFEPTNPRPTSPPDVGGSVQVAGMNVLNYFNTFDGLPDNVDNCTNGVGGIATDCRGADTQAEFDRQWPKTVAAILALDPDVLEFNEIENDGYGPTSAIAHLVDRLNAATVPGTYALIDADAGTGQVNALGLDAIKVGMVYKPGVVTPVGQTAVLNSVAFVNGGDSAPRNRPALAQAFRENATGAVFVAVGNHLKSKGSACDVPDAGDGQGNCNQVRVNAATELVNWLATDPSGTGDPDVLMVGDYNSYAKEDPIRVFGTGGFTNLVELFGGPDAYSYVFDGQWGYLDHALASAPLVAQVAGVADYHINADEPSVLDYNIDFKTANLITTLYAPDQFRVSDHDPVVVGLNLVIPTTTALTIDPSTQQYSDTVTLDAAVSPSGATGSVQFAQSPDGGATWTDLGSPVPVTGGVASRVDVQVLDAAGTNVRFRAFFDGTGVYTDSEDEAAPTVTKEDAKVLYGAGNPVAAQVDAPGSGFWTGPLVLTIDVQERAPDLAGTGSPLPGEIAEAGLAVKLVPLGPGGSIILPCVAGAVTGTGYDAVKPFTCTSPGAIPLGTYEVAVSVTSDYYTGSYADAFTVFDPSLGFATGGGTFVLGGERVSFGFTTKYNKKGTNAQGQFIGVRHHADGTNSRLKSNALSGMAILDVGGCGIATFAGRATYTTWDPAANGGLGTYVTTGNTTFSVRADDCSNPGTGTDKIWIGGVGKLAMPSPTSSNLAPLTGGNIAVPHTIGRK